MYTHLRRLIGPFAAALLTLAGCGGSELGECPPNSQNQQDFGSSILYITCTGCHSQALTGADRQGAPVGKDYDTPAMVRPQSEEIYASVQTGTMPPPDGLNPDQIENLRIYLACGAP